MTGEGDGKEQAGLGDEVELRAELDQLRIVDRERLRRRLGTLSATTMAEVLGILGEMFEA